MVLVAPRIVYSTLFFTLAMLLMLTTRPSPMFDADGRVVPFGVGANKTPFSLGATTVALAVLVFYVFALIDLVAPPGERAG